MGNGDDVWSGTEIVVRADALDFRLLLGAV